MVGKIVRSTLNKMRISKMISGTLVFSILQLKVCAEPASDQEVRILISDFVEIKKDYVLSRKELAERSSRVTDFGKIEWKLPELIKKAESHVNKVLSPLIAPSMRWPPGNYNGGKEYPIHTAHLSFQRMEVHSVDEFLYLVLRFHQVNQVGAQYRLNVVCYLDGEFALIADHDPDSARILPPRRNK